jgi:hypothetical protein
MQLSTSKGWLGLPTPVLLVLAGISGLLLFQVPMDQCKIPGRFFAILPQGICDLQAFP